MGTMEKYDIVVVGGGIAGLATAEIFARSGFSVRLIEKNRYICHEASGIHHEWFHFGSLYSIFPNPQFLRTMVGGIDDLLHYYRDFKGMNLSVTGGGKLITSVGESDWLRSDIIKYIVALKSDSDFKSMADDRLRDKINKLFYNHTWDKAVRQFVSRHNRFKNYDWRRGEASHHIGNIGWKNYSETVIQQLKDSPELNLNSETHILLNGFDRPMNAMNIISDLLRSFISYSGELTMGSAVTSYRKERKKSIVQLDSGEEISCDKLIIACAECVEKITSKVATKTVASPLLVAYPQVYSENIVRMTPFVNKTINHITHTMGGKSYSLIGGGYYADPDNEKQRRTVERDLVSQAHRIFPKLRSAKVNKVYFGKKTEIIHVKLIRNYMYNIDKIEDSVYLIIPGKFSLAFSLAINTYKRIFKHYPNTFASYDRELDVSEYLSWSGHRAIISDEVDHRK